MSSVVRGDGAGRVAGVLARYPESQLLQISGSERTELYRSRETCRSASSDGAVQEQVTEQGDLQERSGSVQRWLTSILAIFRWELKERGDRSDGAVPRAGSP